MSRLRATLVLLTFAGVTLPLMPVQQLFVWFWPRMARVFPMYYHRLVLRILGVRVSIDGEALKQGPAILRGKPCVVARYRDPEFAGTGFLHCQARCECLALLWSAGAAATHRVC